MYEQKDSLKRKSHLKTQQFSIVDIKAFDLPHTALAADTKHSNLLYNVLADSPWLI